MASLPRLPLILFAVSLTALGVLALVYGDFAMQWQPVAPWFPGRTALAYLAGGIMLVCGPALLVPLTEKWAARIVFAYLLIWLLLKVPSLVVAPGMEAVWLGAGEIAVLFTGGWVLLATLGCVGQGTLPAARILFGLSLIPIGLSHLFYPRPTIELVPAWLPFRPALAGITGVAQILCGVAVLARIRPRLAAACEAALISTFATLVWAPAVLSSPGVRLKWTAFWISWAIAAAAWCVAASYEPRPDPVSASEMPELPPAFSADDSPA